jgi:hypothetical protein
VASKTLARGFAGMAGHGFLSSCVERRKEPQFLLGLRRGSLRALDLPRRWFQPVTGR